MVPIRFALPSLLSLLRCSIIWIKQTARAIIALAPNGAPEQLVRLFPQVAESVAQARAMVAAGSGDQPASFTDLNIHGPFPVDTTAAIYLSFFDPAGPCSTT
jgi:hypothetical protein